MPAIICSLARFKRRVRALFCLFVEQCSSCCSHTKRKRPVNEVERTTPWPESSSVAPNQHNTHKTRKDDAGEGAPGARDCCEAASSASLAAHKSRVRAGVTRSSPGAHTCWSSRILSRFRWQSTRVVAQCRLMCALESPEQTIGPSLEHEQR